jgi:hypothetical protein
MGIEMFLRRCVLEHERPRILVEYHECIVVGHYERKDTMQKVLCIVLWWLTIRSDAKEYFQKCDIC